MRTTSETKNDATVTASPNAIAQLYSKAQAAIASAMSQRSGPSTTPAIKLAREAGCSGSKRTEASSLTASRCCQVPLRPASREWIMAAETAIRVELTSARLAETFATSRKLGRSLAEVPHEPRLAEQCEHEAGAALV